MQGQRPTPPAAVQAYIRLRPPEKTDAPDIELVELSPGRPGVITIKDPLSSGRCEHSYEFSRVFDTSSDQQQIFQAVAQDLVDGAVLGRSGAVLAYGQTGSGKTYSVFGEGTDERRGILHRAVERLFIRAAGKPIEVSFVEVYLDQLRDLAPARVVDAPKKAAAAGSSSRPGSKGSTGSGEALELVDGPGGGVLVRGLARHAAANPGDVRRILDLGLRRRATAATAANAGSSRSHTLFMVHVGGVADPHAPASSPGTCLSFVDLAGSERLAKSRAEGACFSEAVAINSSLTALGKVVLALVAGGQQEARHVPYRDSKLTRLLSPSLSGGAQVSLLATLHPRVEDYEECLNTLSFADRCKNLAHNPRVNYIEAQNTRSRRVRELKEQVRSLQEMVQRQQADAQVREGARLGLSDAVDQAIASALAGEPALGAVLGQVAADAGLPAAGGDDEDDAGGSSSSSAAGGACGGAPQQRCGTAFVLPGLGAVASEGLSSPDPRTPAGAAAREAATRALREVQSKRQAEQAAQSQLVRQLQAVSSQKDQIKETAGLRTAENKRLERRQEELKGSLRLLEEQIDKMRAGAAQHLQEAFGQVKADVDKKLAAVNNALTRMTRNVEKRLALSAQQKKDFEDRCKIVRLEHSRAVEQVKERKKLCHSQVEARWRERLAAARGLCGQLSEALAGEGLLAAQAAAEGHGELLRLADLADYLAALICDAEEGRFPATWRGGLKAVVLPDGLPPEPNCDEFPKLGVALAEAGRVITTLEQAARPDAAAMLAGRTRRLLAAAAGKYDLSQLAAAPLGASALRSGGAGMPGRLSIAEVAEERDGASERGPAPAEAEASPVDSPPGGVAEFLEALCQTPDADRAEALVGALCSEDDLRRLCLGLRTKVQDVCAPRLDEKERFRQEALASLDGEATLQHVRSLEARRNEARAALATAAEERRRLQGQLGSARSMRPHSAGSFRTAQTPTTRTPSRGSSRPTTATWSRPPTAPLHSQRRAPSSGRSSARRP